MREARQVGAGRSSVATTTWADFVDQGDAYVDGNFAARDRLKSGFTWTNVPRWIPRLAVTEQQLHPAAYPLDVLSGQCRAERLRRSGPGGQHRNKVETAIRLVHEPTGVVAEASERRSQEENRRQALRRLRVKLALRVRCPVASNSASELWRSRLQGRRIQVSPEHEDFPALLAEALDRVAAAEYDVRSAAEGLGCSSSQLVKLLKVEPQALEQINRAREAAGLERLR